APSPCEARAVRGTGSIELSRSFEIPSPYFSVVGRGNRSRSWWWCQAAAAAVHSARAPDLIRGVRRSAGFDEKSSFSLVHGCFLHSVFRFDKVGSGHGLPCALDHEIFYVTDGRLGMNF